jgi:hypothetical protein
VRDQSNYVWIVLDEEDDAIDSVTFIPLNENFVLPCAYVTDVESRFRLASNTIKFLKSHCSNGTNS